MGHDLNEKHTHLSDDPPIAPGIQPTTNSNDVEYARRSSRKASIVQSIKADYGLTDTAGISEDGSIKMICDNAHRKLKPRHIQLIGIGEIVSLYNEMRLY
jgi:amino acid permease